MNQNEIDNQINQELDKFKDSKYNGTIKVPDNMIELFRKGILHLAPQYHKLNFTRVKQLIQMKPNELSVGDITDVARIILNTPFEILYGSIDLMAAIDLQIKLEKFMVAYNVYIDDFQGKLRMKKATLKSLTDNHSPIRTIN